MPTLLRPRKDSVRRTVSSNASLSASLLASRLNFFRTWGGMMKQIAQVPLDMARPPSDVFTRPSSKSLLRERIEAPLAAQASGRNLSTGTTRRCTRQ